MISSMTCSCHSNEAVIYLLSSENYISISYNQMGRYCNIYATNVVGNRHGIYVQVKDTFRHIYIGIESHFQVKDTLTI